MQIEDFFENVFDAYKKYIESNSSYGVKVFKFYNDDSPYLPTTICGLSNNADTNESTIDKIEYYEAFYFTITHYAKDKTIQETIDDKVVSKRVSAKIINDETRKLTISFFKNLNMRKTLDRPIPNLDKSILRNRMQYQCYVGNARIDIIRR